MRPLFRPPSDSAIGRISPGRGSPVRHFERRTDARGVVTTYGYDNLNRLSTISYNVGSTGVPATPGVTFTYDQGGAAVFALGRLTSMTDGVGSETYTYNNLGEMTGLQKVINGTTYPLSYAYNFAGELSSITYPSNRAVQQNLDNIGRLSSITDTLNSVNTTRASGFAYNPAFQVTGFNYGNGVAAAFGYTQDRFLLQSLAYTNGATTLFSANYWYKTDSTNCPSAPAGNNGQIQCITDNVDSGRSATFTYDALYRLSTAATTGSTSYPQWGLSWAYDQYGNRLNQTQTAGSPPQNSLSFANPGGAQTNRPDNMCFDVSGNLMTETSVSPCPPSNPTYTYDAENRLMNYMGSSATYTFDGNGLRVTKAASGTTTVYIFSGSKVIAEYDNGAAPASPSREYIYSGGALLAKIESGASIYYHPDHLSIRVLTDSSGNSLGQRGHYPFGETWYESGTITKLQFTTYERDSESTNDYAMARTYINRFGRFPSSDPLAGSTGDPQSLNRYTYGRNVPVSIIDPSGMTSSGCLYLKNLDAPSSSESSGGPSALSDEDAGSSPPEPQACPPGGSGGAGFPIGGGDILAFLFEFADPNSDLSIGTPFWTGEGWQTRDDLSALDLFAGLPAGISSDPGPLMGPQKQPPPPLECRPEFIAQAKAAWQRAVLGFKDTEAGFFARGSFSNPTYAPTPWTNEVRRISFQPWPTDIAMMHTHPRASSDFPSPPPAVDQTGYLRPGDHQWVPVYTGSKGGLFVSDPTSKLGYTKLRDGLDWLNPCP